MENKSLIFVYFYRPLSDWVTYCGLLSYNLHECGVRKFIFVQYIYIDALMHIVLNFHVLGECFCVVCHIRVTFSMRVTFLVDVGVRAVIQVLR